MAYWRTCPEPPAGSLVVVVESDVPCTCEAMVGRKWDSTMPKPAMAANMGDQQWGAFRGEMGTLVKSYRREALGLPLLLVGFLLGFLLFHPSFGVAKDALHRRRLDDDAKKIPWSMYESACVRACGSSRETCVRTVTLLDDARVPGTYSCCFLMEWKDSCTPSQVTKVKGAISEPLKASEDESVDKPGGFGGTLALMLACIIIPIFVMIALQITGREANQAVDRKVELLCQRATAEAAPATFTYLTAWTRTCKPKHARTYRALCIAPGRMGGGGATGVVATGVVATAMVQPTINMRVTVPPGVGPGAPVALVSPGGVRHQVVVPPGLKPGDTFEAQLPADPVATVAASVPAPVPMAQVVGVLPPPVASSESAAGQPDGQARGEDILVAAMPRQRIEYEGL